MTKYNEPESAHPVGGVPYSRTNADLTTRKLCVETKNEAYEVGFRGSINNKLKCTQPSGLAAEEI